MLAERQSTGISDLSIDAWKITWSYLENRGYFMGSFLGTLVAVVWVSRDLSYLVTVIDK